MRAGTPAASDGDGSPFFRLLGPVRVGLPGTPATRPGPPRQQAVLSTLLLRRRRPVTVAELVAAVWGHDAPASAAGNLRTYAWGLRTLLEPGRAAGEPARVLRGDEHGYALHTPPESVDAWRFEQQTEAARQARERGDTAAEHALLADALALWSGEALAGVPGPFAEEERTRLAALRTTARKRHLVCALRLGLHHTVIPELTALTAEFPLDEELRALHMRALHGCGRQAEAFTVFADTHRVLAEELAVTPCPELTALHARLLARNPPPLVPRQAHAPARPPEPTAALPDGAERALATAKRALTEGADRGGVPVLAITGPGGAGKTALAARIADGVAARFPDGRLFADLRTWSPVPGGPGPLLAHLLHALGVPAARIPADPEQRAALYRSALATRRVLVVLDGARDAAQVAPLLPGTPGSAVVLTTRSRVLAPTLPASTRIELPAPPPADPSGGADGSAPDSIAPNNSAPNNSAPDTNAPDTKAPDGDERDGDERDSAAPGQEDLPPELARAARRLRLTLTRSGAGAPSVDALAAVLGTGPADAALMAEALVDAGVLDTPAPGTYCLPARP
ncbi:BTAD domain-containing putative transcriptional regulator [Streptomyces sp. NPDC096136]|uniref:AfsR/SARP family transcriptional regulator n=1 Tax=Streptomyces sp. NPDC096136 TaxID=3366076 RepID=UPI003812EB97